MKFSQRQPGNKMAMPARTILLSFAGIILAGTLLLCLPVASKPGQATTLLNALYTATSATCVTGLVVYDTYSHWSPFGQVIILTLIQIGGLGLVTFTTFFNLIIGRKLGLRGMQTASESVGSDTVAELPRMIRLVVVTSLIVEGVGAALLCLSFVPRYGPEGVGIAVFLAVSAFCNAGFDILGRESEYISLCNYNGDYIVLYTIMALIIIGGLGFVVWMNLLEYRQRKHLFVHTKVVLAMTALLILTGTAMFLLLEWGNPRTLGALPFHQRVNAALFQSVSLRTAGFNSVDVAGLREITKIGSIVYMFIGAAPGSTGGGIKVTALAVMIMTVACVMRGHEDTVMLKRRVSKNTVYKALAVMTLGALIVGIAATTIVTTSKIDDVGITGVDVVFEAVSAFATVGLSAGVTGVANLPSKIILILTMFIGRVGPVTFVLSMAMRSQQKRKEVIPEGKIYL